jgi:hypothetical protein
MPRISNIYIDLVALNAMRHAITEIASTTRLRRRVPARYKEVRRLRRDPR